MSECMRSTFSIGRKRCRITVLYNILPDVSEMDKSKRAAECDLLQDHNVRERFQLRPLWELQCQR
jgi:hypothetical protein